MIFRKCGSNGNANNTEDEDTKHEGDDKIADRFGIIPRCNDFSENGVLVEAKRHSIFSIEVTIKK